MLDLNILFLIIVAKDFSQYEPIFLQMSEDKKTVNAFELADLLEACLPNGKTSWSSTNSVIFWFRKYYTYILIFFSVLNYLDYIKSCASIEVCRQIVIAFDSTALGRITFENFKDLMCSLKVWHNVFKNWTKVRFFVSILFRKKVENHFDYAEFYSK